MTPLVNPIGGSTYRLRQVESSGFLELRCHEFTEKAATGEGLATQPRDYVVPARVSSNTIACAVLRKSGGTILIGLDEDNLPAAQCFAGSSALWVTPAWRLPLGCEDRAANPLGTRGARAFLRSCRGRHERARRPLSSVCRGHAEIVYPLAVSVRLSQRGTRTLLWVPLAEVVQQIDRIQDGHLRIAALRSAHALGIGG